MVGYNFTPKAIEFVEKAIELNKKGFYIDSTQLTLVYNSVLNKNVNVTNCGACLKIRINELEAALNHYKQNMANEAILKPTESVLDDEVNSIKDEENKELTKAETMKERMAKVRAARKQNKK